MQQINSLWKMKKILNYINGELVAPKQDAYLENVNPAIGEVYSLIPDSDASDVREAVLAAKQAFPAWSALTIQERSEWLLKIAHVIDTNHERLALAESEDNGKPLNLAKQVDIPRAATNFRFYGTALLHTAEHAYQTNPELLNYTSRHPVGVAGCISPWNLPLYLFTWKIAPALAAGCTVVAKPSEITPMTAFLLSELCVEIGLPAGVLNIVHGLGNKVGQSIVSHPDVPAISFTGGTKTGQAIARVAAPMFKKLSLELGGKNPNIIFADADLNEAVGTSIRSSFANQGQICLCGSRILIEESIYETFKERFIDKVKALKVGDPLEKVNLGAVVSEAHHAKVMRYVALAQEEGGRILCGGKSVSLPGRCANGYFIEPTVIEGLSQQCRTNQEEIFGPVVTLDTFSSVPEAIEKANATKYGLAASVWTSNVKTAHQVGQALQSGIVWVNCWMMRDLRTPFGGMKQSGVGREGGFEAINFFTEEKNICMKL